MKLVIRIMIGALGVLAVLLAGAAAWFLYPGPRTTLEEHVARLDGGFEFVLPDSEGPHPVVLLFHGCGGLVGEEGEKLIMQRYARTAAEAGYAAVIVDSFGPRGIGFHRAITRVCPGMRLRGPSRAADVLAAISYARSQPDIDASRIVLAGWSHGGWTVMDLMTMDLEHQWPATLRRPPGDILDGVTGLYLTYPFCGFPARSTSRDWQHFVPTSVVIAENDTVVRTEACSEALERMDTGGVVLEIEQFDGVTHAFDEEDHTAQSSFAYDEAATSRAHQRFASYLRDLEAGAPFPNPVREGR